MQIMYTHDDGDEVTVDLPSKFEVCSRCEGHGTHLTPSIGEHAYSAEEFDETFERGSDEREQYFRRGGIYDVSCEECKGKRVVEVVDVAACRTPEQKAHLKAWRAHERQVARWDAEDRATYRMESGGFA